MNKYQGAMLIAAAINLLLMLLFPPYEYLSYTHGSVPNFDGFLPAFGDHPNRRVNDEFLAIEIFTVLVNAAIAWLLLRTPARPGRRLGPQNLVLLGVGLNLILALLFPPFQNNYTGSRALLPSFDGFYFLFADNSMRVLVTSMLWVEVVFVLVNGAILWLLLHKPVPRELTDAERFAQAEELLRLRRKK